MLAQSLVSALPAPHTVQHLASVAGLVEDTGRPATTPPESSAGFEYLASGVTVVTSSDDAGERYGVTTTSVCALSAEPPVLVACVRRRSKLGRNLPRTRRFCVNVLSARQRAVADAFAGRKGVELDRFHHGRWTTGTTGSPVLDGTLASFECAVDLLYAYPNHLIVVGAVEQATTASASGDPLLSDYDQLAVPA